MIEQLDKNVAREIARADLSGDIRAQIVGVVVAANELIREGHDPSRVREARNKLIDGYSQKLRDMYHVDDRALEQEDPNG